MTYERKAFEAWAISRAYSLNKNVVFGNYLDGNVEFAWQVWQARGAQQEPVGAIVQDESRNPAHTPMVVWFNQIPAIGTNLFTSPLPQPDAVTVPEIPDWLYQMSDVIPYISRNKQSGVKLVFTSDDMADNFCKWLADKDVQFVKMTTAQEKV